MTVETTGANNSCGRVHLTLSLVTVYFGRMIISGLIKRLTVIGNDALERGRTAANRLALAGERIKTTIFVNLCGSGPRIRILGFRVFIEYPLRLPATAETSTDNRES